MNLTKQKTEVERESGVHQEKLSKLFNSWRETEGKISLYVSPADAPAPEESADEAAADGGPSFDLGYLKINREEKKDGLVYFPYIMTLFMFIVCAKFLGLIPTSFTPTSHFAVTAVLALLVFVSVTVLGFVAVPDVPTFAA